MARILALAEHKAMNGLEGMWNGEVDLAAIEREVEDRFAPLDDGSNVVSGKAEVLRSSNHLRVGDQEIFLYGVMPPWSGWCKSRSNRRCTVEVTDAVVDMVDGQNMSCTWLRGLKAGGYIPKTVCYLEGEEEPINLKLLRDGLMLPGTWGPIMTKSRKMHKWTGAYREARRERKGIWKGAVKVPENYMSEELGN